MISVSTTYNNLTANGGHYEWQVKNGTNTFTKSNLISGTITRTAYEKLTVGNVLSAQLDLELNNVAVDTGNPLRAQFRATNGTTNSAWYTKGYFFVDTVETSPYSQETLITAYDAMMKASVVYIKEGEWAAGTTDEDIVTQIALDISVDMSLALSNALSANPLPFDNAPNIGPNGTTEMEMLSIIGVMRGWNFFINYNGELDYECPFAARANTAQVGDAVVSFDASPAETVSKVKVWLNGTTYFRKPDYENDGVTDEAFEALAGLCLVADCRFMASQDVADRLYNLTNGYVNYPYDAQTAYVDPKYEIGDGITIKNVISEIANFTLTMNALAPSDLQFLGEEIINSYYPYIDPIKKEIERAETQTSASISVLEQSINSQVSQINETLNGENGVVQSISNLQQTANGFTLTLTNINADLTELQQYLTYENGVLTLGETGSPFKAQLDNTQLAFVQNGNVVAYVSNNKLFISNGQIVDNLQIGNYQWITQSDGRMSLKWVG